MKDFIINNKFCWFDLGLNSFDDSVRLMNLHMSIWPRTLSPGSMDEVVGTHVPQKDSALEHFSCYPMLELRVCAERRSQVAGFHGYQVQG